MTEIRRTAIDQIAGVEWLILSRSSLATRKSGLRLAGIWTRFRVLGLSHSRASRTRTRKLPNPRISIRSLRTSASAIDPKMMSTTISMSLFEMCRVLEATLSMSWFFVIALPDRSAASAPSKSLRFA